MVDIHRVRATWTGVAGSPAYFNVYFEGLADSTVAQADTDAVEGFLTRMAVYQLPVVRWTTDGVVQNINSITGDATSTVPVTTGTGVGGNSGNLVPNASQVLIHLHTGVFQAGREIRGRLNIPYFITGTVDGAGDVDTATALDVADAFGDMIALPGASTPVVWSRKTGQAPTVNRVAVWREWAVIRSRRD